MYGYAKHMVKFNNNNKLLSQNIQTWNLLGKEDRNERDDVRNVTK